MDLEVKSGAHWKEGEDGRMLLTLSEYGISVGASTIYPSRREPFSVFIQKCSTYIRKLVRVLHLF